MKLDYSKPQFLWHPIDDCVLRIPYNENSHVLQVFVRFSGEKEYPISDSIHLFTNATIQEDPISEREYWESQGE
ncbi:MAG: hypothetical protein ACM3O3_05755 [Syntrophothermus sp.]